MMIITYWQFFFSFRSLVECVNVGSILDLKGHILELSLKIIFTIFDKSKSNIVQVCTLGESVYISTKVKKNN